MSNFKFRYMHINKCAGTSFYKWMQENNISPTSGHHGDHQIELNFLPQITNTTTVRNPYDRIKSHYNNWTRDGWLKENLQFGQFIQELPRCYENNSCKTLIKDEYVDRWAYIPDFRSPIGIRFIKPCSYWIKYIDKFKIFYFENLGEIDSFFRDKGFEIKNGISNVIAGKTTTERKKSYIEDYTKNEIKIINDLFHDDFVNFNYKKVEL